MGLFTTYKGLESEQNVKYKNLPFNTDNGFTSQPFIQTPIPGDDGVLSVANSTENGLVKTVNSAAAGFLNLNDKLKISPTVSYLAQGIYRSSVDVVRLTKFMSTPSGIEFIAKQELLSLMSPRTETSGVLNGGVYNPLSTLAQAGVNIAGVHIPTYQNSDYRIRLGWSKKKSGEYDKLFPGYGRLVYERGLSDPNVLKYDNRLVKLLNKHITKQYAPNTDLFHTQVQAYIGGPGSYLGAGFTSIDFATNPKGDPIRTMGKNFTFPVGKGKINRADLYQAVYNHPDMTWYEKRLFEQQGIKSIETQYGLGNPGRKVFDESKYKWIYPSTSSSLDTVNGQIIYSSAISEDQKKTIDSKTSDLVMFKVGVIDIHTYKTNYMHFRSFIDSFSDSYSSDWSSQTYMGRGEKLYKYNSFDRSINMSFTVAAQSRGEMASMYQKLNYLASTVTPQYTDKGYMTGNIVKLTMGNYVKDQHGKIDSISLEIPEDSPWLVDLGGMVGATPTPPQYQLQSKHDLKTIVNELPFIIKVQMRFTPIHDFRPELSTNVLDGEFGDQRYITKNYQTSSPEQEQKINEKIKKQQNIEEVQVNAKGIKRNILQGSGAPLFSKNNPQSDQLAGGLTEDYSDYGWDDFWEDIGGKKIISKEKRAIRKFNKMAPLP